jgi:hypothetical protein
VSAWALGAWGVGAWAGTAWAEGAPVGVPDVVGLSQADATTALEAAGFVVAVTTAASSTVPVGYVISQAPVGGAMATAGSTVTIVVSTGDSPAVNPLLHGTRRKNVQFRPLKKPEIEPVQGAIDPPAEDEIKAAIKAHGVNLELLPAPQPATDTPRAPVHGPVKPQAKLALVAAPAAAALETAAAVAELAPTPAPTPAAPVAVDPVAELAKIVAAQNTSLREAQARNTALQAQVDEIATMLRTLQTEVQQRYTEAQQEIEAREQTEKSAAAAEQARKAKNRKRAEELAKKLLED